MVLSFFFCTLSENTFVCVVGTPIGLQKLKRNSQATFMKASPSVRIVLLLVLLIIVGGILAMQSGRAESHAASTSLPDLEYLKAINSVGPPQDPQLLFLLMTA